MMPKGDDYMSDLIYRYMSYSEFLDILFFNRLTMRYPGNWPDKLEALFLKSFEKQKEINKLADEYGKIYPNYSLLDTISDFQIISSVLIKSRCQCWTHKENDLVLWNERKGNESVRIGVREELFDKYDVQGKGVLVHRDVKYIPKVIYKTIINLFVEADRRVTDFVTVKKNVFKYENEHRLVLLPNDHSFSTPSYGDTLSEALSRHFLGTKSEFGLQDKYIVFDPQNIVSVKSSPYSTDAFSKLVEVDCKRFDLSYDGISTILD